MKGLRRMRPSLICLVFLEQGGGKALVVIVVVVRLSC